MFSLLWQTLVNFLPLEDTMTKDEKVRIVDMRKSGIGYLRIAKTLNLSVNTIRSFYHRHIMASTTPIETDLISIGIARKFCKQCGNLFYQYPGHREKMFCCDACRLKWWNSHLSEVERKAMYDYTCPTCGNKFIAYGNRHRKYCSRACYIKGRYGDTSCA